MIIVSLLVGKKKMKEIEKNSTRKFPITYDLIHKIKDTENLYFK